MSKEEIIAKQFGWTKFSSGPVMCETTDFIACMDQYADQRVSEALIGYSEWLCLNSWYCVRPGGLWQTCQEQYSHARITTEQLLGLYKSTLPSPP